SKRMCIACVVLATAVLVSCTILVRQRIMGPTRFQRIRSGMSLREVEKLIGLPYGDYFTRREDFDGRVPYWTLRQQRGEAVHRLRTSTTEVGGKKVSVRSWRGNDYHIQVAFDENDGAVAWSLHEAAEWSVIERVRGWFGE